MGSWGQESGGHGFESRWSLRFSPISYKLHIPMSAKYPSTFPPSHDKYIWQVSYPLPPCPPPMTHQPCVMSTDYKSLHSPSSHPGRIKYPACRATFTPPAENSGRGRRVNPIYRLAWRSGHTFKEFFTAVHSWSLSYTPRHSLHVTGMNWTCTWPASGEASRASHRYCGGHGFESRWSLGILTGLYL